MNGTKQFEEAIKAYLDARAVDDADFAKKYVNEKKSVEECCDFIFGEVSASGCQGYTDDEIFGLAVHYYDEDEIKIKPSNVARVVTNSHVDLTDAEKAEARAKAIEAYQNEIRKGLITNKTTSKPKPFAEEQSQLNLF